MPDLTPGAPMKIGRYEVLDEIGQGAMGTVYRARDPLIERTVAIKTVSISLLQQEGADAEVRFLREAQSAGRLSHPNIVTIYDVGEADGLAYIAMEYLPGATLREVMNKGPIPLDLALETALQMAEALAFAHENGVIHRDIKPANVVVTGQNGRVKLTDFGIAHLVNSDHTHAGQMLGSPRYMSPEQAMGNEVDGRSDIFSLGAVLYEMLTGHYAFDGDSLPAIMYRVINETPVPAESLRPQLPAELASLLARMLSKAPEDRPDARALVEALRAGAPAAPPVVEPPSARRRSRLAPVLALAALAGLAVVVWRLDPFAPAAPRKMPAPIVSPGRVTQPAPPPDAGTEPDDQGPGAAGEPAPHTPPPPVEMDGYLAGLDRKQVELRIKRTELLLQYTTEHPDVKQIDRQLEQLRIERRNYLRKQKKAR